MEVDEEKCDHVLGQSSHDDQLVAMSDLVNGTILAPLNQFDFCPRCGKPIEWNKD